MDNQRFCDHCHVTLDLHPWPDEESESNCDIARMKADVLDQFSFLGRR